MELTLEILKKDKNNQRLIGMLEQCKTICEDITKQNALNILYKKFAFEADKDRGTDIDYYIIAAKAGTDQVVGAMAMIDNFGYYSNGTKDCLIDATIVDPSIQGAGISPEMFNYAEENAKGTDRFISEIYTFNERSLSSRKKMGFEQLGDIEEKKEEDGDVSDYYVMQKAVDKTKAQTAWQNARPKTVAITQKPQVIEKQRREKYDSRMDDMTEAYAEAEELIADDPYYYHILPTETLQSVLQNGLQPAMTATIPAVFFSSCNPDKRVKEVNGRAIIDYDSTDRIAAWKLSKGIPVSAIRIRKDMLDKSKIHLDGLDNGHLQEWRIVRNIEKLLGIDKKHLINPNDINYYYTDNIPPEAIEFMKHIGKDDGDKIWDYVSGFEKRKYKKVIGKIDLDLGPEQDKF